MASIKKAKKAIEPFCPWSKMSNRPNENACSGIAFDSASAQTRSECRIVQCGGCVGSMPGDGTPRGTARGPRGRLGESRKRCWSGYGPGVPDSTPTGHRTASLARRNRGPGPGYAAAKHIDKLFKELEANTSANHQFMNIEEH